MADGSIDPDVGKPEGKPALSEEAAKYKAMKNLSGAQRRKRRKARLEAAGVDVDQPGILGSKGGRKGGSKRRRTGGEGEAVASSGAGAAAEGAGK